MFFKLWEWLKLKYLTESASVRETQLYFIGSVRVSIMELFHWEFTYESEWSESEWESHNESERKLRISLEVGESKIDTESESEWNGIISPRSQLRKWVKVSKSKIFIKSACTVVELFHWICKCENEWKWIIYYGLNCDSLIVQVWVKERDFTESVRMRVRECQGFHWQQVWQ